MSPAPLAVDSQQDQQLKTLARGFEALLLITQKLSTKEKVLQTRLEYAYNEYLKLANRLPGEFNTHTKVISEKILGRYVEFENPKQTLNPPDVVKYLEESEYVEDLRLTAVKDGLECYKSVLNPHDVSEPSSSNSCLVKTRAGYLEKDFTTKGTRGSLHCPFVKPHNKASENGVDTNSNTCGHEDLDPIKAEKNDKRPGQAGSIRTSTSQCPISRCPIRFLDQHSPEEIAEYVERHKHEIPRSHTICVKRYSKDSRQLDAKYGSLINMIQGLSAKHQAFLPGHSQASIPTASSPNERVEKWAEEVIKSEEEPIIQEGAKSELGDEDENNQDEERKGHFSRSLREVRVGESPSRPWGIHVPLPLTPVLSDAQSPVAPAPASINNQPDKNGVDGLSSAQLPPPVSARPAGGCPFGHGRGVPPADHPAIEIESSRDEGNVTKVPDVTKKDETKTAHAPEILCSPKDHKANLVFNGPVFFGFSPEQTAAFLQQLSSLGISGFNQG